ncbi:UNKNOWN [Stylonychia lemnae]|uniref:Uncharacterized protein n=1 Tax=Stylonychia lemnae TaxID=5949 RepID=A0A078AKQ2_STYLE|nr:UNKNOWN [Stylonychia lemnae]|eukprot:CDW82471.1 UNKNOWN [Stylonychia lemnae]
MVKGGKALIVSFSVAVFIGLSYVGYKYYPEYFQFREKKKPIVQEPVECLEETVVEPEEQQEDLEIVKFEEEKSPTSLESALDESAYQPQNLITTAYDDPYHLEIKQKVTPLLTEHGIEKFITAPVEESFGQLSIEPNTLLKMFKILKSLYHQEILSIRDYHKNQEQLKGDKFNLYIKQFQNYQKTKQDRFRAIFEVVSGEVRVPQKEFIRNIEILRKDQSRASKYDEINQKLEYVVVKGSNLSAGDTIRELCSSMADAKLLLIKPQIQEFIQNTRDQELRDFIDYLISDQFYKRTGLQEDQYQILLAKHQVIAKTPVQSMSAELIELLYLIRERLYGKRNVQKNLNKSSKQYRDQVLQSLGVYPEIMFDYQRNDCKTLLQALLKEDKWTDLMMVLDDISQIHQDQ